MVGDKSGVAFIDQIFLSLVDQLGICFFPPSYHGKPLKGVGHNEL